MYLDPQGHVQRNGIGQYSSSAEIHEFVKDFPRSDMSILKLVVPAKMKFLLMRIGGRSGFTINGQPVGMTEVQIDEARRELQIWKDIAERVR